MESKLTRPIIVTYVMLLQQFLLADRKQVLRLSVGQGSGANST